MANTHRHYGGPYGGPLALDYSANYQTVSSGPLYQEFCGPCGRLFQDKDEILWHRLLSQAHNPMILCPTHKNIQFREVEGLRMHILNNDRCYEAFKANPDGRGLHNCKNCRILISNPIELDRHLKTPEHAQNLRRCDACGLKFRSAEEQIAHNSRLAVKHQRGAAQICRCGWVLVSPEQLVKHIETRHRSAAPPMSTTYKQTSTHPPPPPRPNTRSRVPTPALFEEDGDGYLSSASSATSTGSIKDEITKLNTQLNTGKAEPNRHKCVRNPKYEAPQDSPAPNHHQAQPRALGSSSQQPRPQIFPEGRNTRAKLEQHRLRNATSSRMEEERKKEKEKKKEKARKRRGSINLIIFD